MDDEKLGKNNIYHLIDSYWNTLRLIKMHCDPYVLKDIEVLGVDSLAYQRGFSYKASIQFPNKNTKVYAQIHQGKLFFFVSVNDAELPDTICCFADLSVAINLAMDEEKLEARAGAIPPKKKVCVEL